MLLLGVSSHDFEPNVRSKNKYTKRSSVLLLSLVYLFSERTLKEAKSLLS